MWVAKPKKYLVQARATAAGPNLHANLFVLTPLCEDCRQQVSLWKSAWPRSCPVTITNNRQGNLKSVKLELLEKQTNANGSSQGQCCHPLSPITWLQKTSSQELNEVFCRSSTCQHNTPPFFSSPENTPSLSSYTGAVTPKMRLQHPSHCYPHKA